MIRSPFLLLALVAAGCAGAPPRREPPTELLARLGAGEDGGSRRGVAEAPTPEAPSSGVTAASPASAPAAGHSSGPPAAEDGDATLAATPLGVVEERLLGDLRAMHVAGGRHALEALLPGDDLWSRLRFCYCRILLQREDDARAELERILAAVPRCASAQLALGKLDLDCGRAEEALSHLRAARAIERSRQLAPHPELGTLLGMAMLRTNESAAGERLLREELATGARPAAAALQLADFFADAERLPEALAVVDAALERVPEDPDLRSVRVDLLVDLGRVGDALAAQREIAAAMPNPLQRLKLVHVLRQAGEFAAAATLLQELITVTTADADAANGGAERERPPAGDGEARTAGVRLADLQALSNIVVEERTAGRRLAFADRELVAVVRNADSVADRIAALRELAQRNRGRPLERALRIALHAGDATLRIAGMRAYYELAKVPHEAVRGGLADEDPRVRGAAARLACRLPVDVAVELLLPSLEREAAPYAFRQMHDALAALSAAAASRGPAIVLPLDAEQDAGTRQRVAAAWRQHWHR